MTKLVKTGYSYSLLTLSVISILGLLATGHNISFGDSGQMKFILEAIIFLLTGFLLLRRQSSAGIYLTILLILTQLSLTDIYLEIIREGNSIGITVLFIIMTVLTIYFIFWGRSNK